MYTQILVAVDSSAHAKTVIEHTREIATLARSAVHVLHVIPTETIEGQTLSMEELATARTFVDTLAETLANAGLRVTTEVREADSRQMSNTVLKQATNRGSDLVIIGARRHAGLLTVFGGSIADQIAHHSRCPVLLIP